MNKQKSAKVDTRPWVYMVYNWGSPIGCFFNGYCVVAMVKYLVDKWGNPPEGAITVERYRVSRDCSDLVKQDITKSIMKAL